MAYVRHDENCNPENPQPGSTEVQQFAGTEGWSTVTYKNFNADYQARNADNSPRTPAAYQRHDENNNPVTPAAYQRHDEYNNPVNDGDGSTIFDLTGGSLPSGMYQYTGSNAQPTLTWGSEGATFTGDAGSGQYPLRLPTEFTGDYLFQLSTRIDKDSSSTTNWCSDASIAVFNTSYTSGSGWGWKWGTQGGRISAQNNCQKPYIYGYNQQVHITQPSQGNVLTTPYVSDGTWVTMHFYHEPSMSRSRYKVTVGERDWEATGTQLGASPNGGVLQIGNSFSGTYWVGISGDDDVNSMIANGFRYIAL